MRYWLALTPALSQTWEREQDAPLSSLAPILPELGEWVGGWGLNPKLHTYVEPEEETDE